MNIRSLIITGLLFCLLASTTCNADTPGGANSAGTSGSGDCNFDFAAYLKKVTSDQVKGKSIDGFAIPECALTKDTHYSGGQRVFLLKDPSPYKYVIYREYMVNNKLHGILVAVHGYDNKVVVGIALDIRRNGGRLVETQKVKGELAKATKNTTPVQATPKYQSSAKKSSVEGDYLTGVLTKAEIEPVESSKSASGYSQYILIFQLSDVLDPAPSPVSCHNYILGPANSYAAHTQIDSYKKMASEGARMFLTQVRSKQNDGNCQIAAINPINIHTATATQKSDIETATSEQKSRRDAIYAKCKASQKLNRHYRCDCHADKALGIMKLFPSDTDNLVSIKIKEDCVNVAAITAYEHKRCTGSTFRTKIERQGLPVEEYCQCYTGYVEKKLVDEGYANLRQFENMKANAMSHCKKAGKR